MSSATLEQDSPSSQETAKLLRLCGLNAAVIIGYQCLYDSLKEIASRCLQLFLVQSHRKRLSDEREGKLEREQNH